MLAIFLSVTYLLTLAVLSFNQYMPTMLFIFIISLNVLSFLFYLLDKYKAKNGYWRIKESTLHFLSLLGGWPGAAIAQQGLKHKNRKKSFQIRYWLTVMANIAVLTTLLYFSHGANKQW
ncbi:DUF1294 domain-containing protein [Colwellia sp.]|uniref:DUF1294 domain-containing protein n=1 Tax=Colwellia sp. TaxID=56799 RepID=UPI0025BE4132|nr:DUF1294 domain-containing protein [Colwellia sp.]